MTELKFNMTQTLAIAAVVLFAGNEIKKRSKFLQKYCIPAPVVSGLIVSALILVFRQTGVVALSFDTTLQNLFMIAFFSTVGFMASLKLLAQGGIGVALMLGVATLLVVFQDIIGCFMAQAFGLDPRFGLVVGSIPLTGGHGTVGAFGKTIEDLGVAGAQTAGFAAATYGLVMGCLIGGPMGRFLLNRHKITPHDDKKIVTEAAKEVVGTDITEAPLTGEKLINAAICIAVAMGVGTLIGPFVKEHTQWITKGGVSLPAYIGPMLVAALIRNVTDYVKKPIPMESIDALGSIGLSIFLSMAMMTMQLWQLIELALPIIAILFVQTVFILIYVYFVTYNVMRLPIIGSKYDSVAMVTGHCGFGLGATPTAVANMTAFCDVFGFSTKAFFIIPLVGALFIDFTNAAVITAFINIFSK